MPVIRAADRTTKQGAASTFSGTVFQDEVVVGADAVAHACLGGVVHAGRAHGVARASGGADALLPVRRRAHLLRGREAAGTEPRRYGR